MLHDAWAMEMANRFLRRLSLVRIGGHHTGGWSRGDSWRAGVGCGEPAHAEVLDEGASLGAALMGTALHGPQSMEAASRFVWRCSMKAHRRVTH